MFFFQLEKQKKNKWMGKIKSCLFYWLQYCVSYQQNICSCISYISCIITCSIGDNRAWMVLEQPALVEGSLSMAQSLELDKL